MNREVLFRGKRVDNGEWVYGGICDYGGGVSIFVVNHYEGSLYEPPYTDLDEVDVDPSTVGEFTGLYDKNGKEIYEGDIVKEKESGIIGYIAFHKQSACFRIVFSKSDTGLGNRGIPGTFLEVIGNIADNPELLKGGEE